MRDESRWNDYVSPTDEYRKAKGANENRNARLVGNVPDYVRRYEQEKRFQASIEKYSHGLGQAEVGPEPTPGWTGWKVVGVSVLVLTVLGMLAKTVQPI